MTPAAFITDEPPDMSWPECFVLRDRLATYWHRRQGRRIPLAEYQSAGNLAMANASRTFDPTTGVPFRHYLRMQLWWTLRHVHRAEAGVGNATKGRPAPRYQVELHSDTWWNAFTPTVASAAPAAAELVSVKAWLATYPRTAMVEALWLAVQGHTEAEVATMLRLTPGAVNKGLDHLRQAYRAWEQGEAAPTRSPQRSRAAIDASRKEHATVRATQQQQVNALQAQGHSTRHIAALAGLPRTTVRRLLAAA